MPLHLDPSSQRLDLPHRPASAPIADSSRKSRLSLSQQPEAGFDRECRAD